MMGYAIATPKAGERVTEFYILGVSGEATDYPRGIKVGEPERVTVGIVNHECEVVSYRVEVKIDGVKNNEIGSIMLVNEQKWEGIVTFTPDKVGDNEKVEFYCIRMGRLNPLWSHFTYGLM